MSDNAYENLADENHLVQATKPGELHRNLEERHMIMIALGGTIGTGLFLASGQALASAGPGGALVSYLAISVMVYFVMTSLGNLSRFFSLLGLTTNPGICSSGTSHSISDQWFIQYIR